MIQPCQLYLSFFGATTIDYLFGATYWYDTIDNIVGAATGTIQHFRSNTIRHNRYNLSLFGAATIENVFGAAFLYNTIYNLVGAATGTILPFRSC
jgi:hypothetical protein